MSCTICKRTGCRADVCRSDIIDESHTELVRMLIETVESTSHELSSWPPCRVSQINHRPSSFIYQGEPNDIRRNICSMREAYLSRDIQTNIKKKYEKLYLIGALDCSNKSYRDYKGLSERIILNNIIACWLNQG